MTNVLDIFPKLDQLLIDVLSDITPEQWQRKTFCKHWQVKDIAAHLLDGSFRRLSEGRDGYKNSAIAVMAHSNLLEYINDQNKTWVNAAKRMSPELLVSLLKQAQLEVFNYLTTLNPKGKAMYPVSWAGQKTSENWFDIAREYTERWLHQQQIRQALGAESLLTKQFYKPFLEICMLALPHHFAKLEVEPGKSVLIKIVGDSGGDWNIKRNAEKWFLSTETDGSTQVYIDQNIAWLLLSGGIDIMEAAQYWQVIGDQALGQHVLNMRTFIV